jgi:putative ABC transport system substrate-binding protein
MKRRQFIAALGASTIVMPFGALAQQPPAKIPRIGVLWHASNAQEENVPLTAMRQGLTEIGYIDGQNVILENRFPAEQPERFQIMAAELVAQKVDVLKFRWCSSVSPIPWEPVSSIIWLVRPATSLAFRS